MSLTEFRSFTHIAVIPPVDVPVEGEYLFDASNSNDTSGNGYNGTDSNMTYVNGIIGAKAAEFNGSNGYIEIQGAVSTQSTPSIIYNITRDFSIGGWLNLDVNNINQTIINLHAYFGNSTTGRGIALQAFSDELRLLLHDNNNLRSILVTNAMNLAIDTDYFIAFTRSGATATFYMGVKGSDNLTTFAFTNSDTTLNTNNIGWTESALTETTNLDIGRQKTSLTNTNYINGTLDDFRIENTAWSLADVEEMYNAGA